jgi:hypothetical protein
MIASTSEMMNTARVGGVSAKPPRLKGISPSSVRPPDRRERTPAAG